MQLEDPRIRYRQLQNEHASTESIPMQTSSQVIKHLSKNQNQNKNQSNLNRIKKNVSKIKKKWQINIIQHDCLDVSVKSI